MDEAEESSARADNSPATDPLWPRVPLYIVGSLLWGSCWFIPFGCGYYGLPWSVDGARLSIIIAAWVWPMFGVLLLWPIVKLNRPVAAGVVTVCIASNLLSAMFMHLWLWRLAQLPF